MRDVRSLLDQAWRRWRAGVGAHRPPWAVRGAALLLWLVWLLWLFGALAAALVDHGHWWAVPAGVAAVLVAGLTFPALLRRMGAATATGQALQESRLRAQAVLDAAVEGVLVVDGTGRIESANPAAGRMFGYPQAELVGRDVSDLVPGDVHETHRRLVTGFDPRTGGGYLMGRGRELWGRRRDGGTFPVEVTLTELRLPGHRKVISTTVRDISERRRFEERLRHVSLHDPLTGLGNRTLLDDRLGRVLARQGRHGGLVAVLMCDIDHFKAINDSLGHGIGDQLLVRVARRLREAVRPEDTVTRFGGDEFVVVCDDLPDETAADHLAQRVLASVSRPVRIAGRELRPTVSVGLVLAPGDRSEPPATSDALIGDADLALLAAKNAGRSRAVTFRPAMREHVLGRLQLANDLHSGLSRDEFEVVYQPVIDLTAGAVTGAEALIRWRHPRRGLLVPDQFLPLAADSDLIVDLDWFVIARACRDLFRVAAELERRLEIWTNLSARTLARPDLADLALDAVLTQGGPADRLILEVTEGALMRDLASTSQALIAVRQRGIQVALDDFGTGYSGLAYLTHLPITAVKLDRGFVTNLADDPVSQAVVQAVTALGRALDLVTVAEGLETHDQVRSATAYGCHLGQGFILGPPTDLAAFTRLARSTPSPG